MRSATSILVIAMAISFAAEGKESPPELVSALVREEADASSGRKVVVQVSDDPTNHRFPLLLAYASCARQYRPWATPLGRHLPDPTGPTARRTRAPWNSSFSRRSKWSLSGLFLASPIGSARQKASRGANGLSLRKHSAARQRKSRIHLGNTGLNALVSGFSSPFPGTSQLFLTDGPGVLRTLLRVRLLRRELSLSQRDR